MKVCRYRVLAIFVVWLALVAPAYSAKYKAPPEIVATLPKFCWAQYVDSAEDNPEYQIQGCGVNVNHYCPGLVHMALARTEKKRSEKWGLLQRAREDMEYTVNNTAAFPECMLRQPAKLNLERIKFDLDMLKLQHR